MNKEDFERLEAVCKKEGFKLLKSLPDKDTNFHILAVSKKDIWDGVEFVECLESYESQFSIGKIYKIRNGKTINDPYFCLDNDGVANGFRPDVSKIRFKPSTESAYIEQLKKEAYERFGEIKEGDRFDRTTIDEKWGSNTIMDKSPFGNFHWKYDRSSDTLFIGRFGIYSKGKWATRVKERVKVDIDQKCWAIISKGKQEIELTFLISKPVPCIEAMKTFLASQLEKHLNGEVE